MFVFRFFSCTVNNSNTNSYNNTSQYGPYTLEFNRMRPLQSLLSFLYNQAIYLSY